MTGVPLTFVRRDCRLNRVNHISKGKTYYHPKQMEVYSYQKFKLTVVYFTGLVSRPYLGHILKCCSLYHSTNIQWKTVFGIANSYKNHIVKLFMISYLGSNHNINMLFIDGSTMAPMQFEKFHSLKFFGQLSPFTDGRWRRLHLKCLYCVPCCVTYFWYNSTKQLIHQGGSKTIDICWHPHYCRVTMSL